MHLIDVMREHGIAVEFLFAFASQAGLPIPAEPALVIAGALSDEGTWRPEVAWLAATFAALLADHIWFAAGRFRGRKLLGLVCRISLSPDTCVRNADSLFHRLGGSVLILGKLIPGVAAVAIPTAAASGMRYSRFILFDALGAAVWSGIWVGLGVIFGREIDRILDKLEVMGNWLPWIVLGFLALWIGFKAWQRRRLKHLYRAHRIAPDEVAELLRADAPLVILDARSELAWTDDPRGLPRAVRVETPEMATIIAQDFRDHTLVSFCTCPNEASAAVVAQQLIAAGFGDVRILAGGTTALDLLAPLA